MPDMYHDAVMDPMNLDSEAGASPMDDEKSAADLASEYDVQDQLDDGDGDQAAEPSAAGRVGDPAAPQQAAEVDGYREWLEGKAKELGYTEEQLAGVADNDSLRQLVEQEANRQRQQAAWQQQQQWAQQPQFPQQPQPQQFPQQQFQLPPQYKPGLDPNAFEQPVIDEFGRLYDHNRQLLGAVYQHFNGRLEQIQQANQSLMAQQQAHAQERLDSYFDAGIAALGESFEQFLGKGDVNDLDRSSLMFAERQKLYQKMLTMSGGASPAQMSRGQVKNLVKDAAYAMYGPNIKSLAKKDVAASVKKRQGAMLARSNSNPSTTHNGRDKAIETIRKFMPDLGDD